MQPRKQIAIIGAGPAGLMAAQMLARAGHAVTVYDRMPSPARKFLIAGRGGLNLTHSEPLELLLTRYGAAADWLAPSIRAFPPAAVRAWCEELGQETFVGSSGRIFPRSMKAVALLRAWLQQLESLGVQYAPRHRWLGWEGDALRFTDAAQQPVLVTPHATLLALGGASWPRLGSDGGWMELLAAHGVETTALRPSNSGFLVPWSHYFSTRFAGEALKPLAVSHQGVTRQGEAMITAQGIEGGVMYALSAPLRDAIEAHGSAQLQLDLRPGMSLEALTQKLQAPRANKSLSSYLRSARFSPLAIALLREVTSPHQLLDASPETLAACLKSLPLTLTATTGIARAISSAGGITRGALDTDFMLRARPGVFAAGEMLDWEAPTGGYLLQGCFSTAVAAAVGITRYCAS
ncbi:MAG: TIGR03862 family flavoprotein [Pseudomonadota bacterium]